jgi:uncharacterized membrane protein YbaN (DUF454 family)
MKFQFFKKWFKTKPAEPAFAKTFPKYPFWTADEKAFHQMLERLDHTTTSQDTRKLVDALHTISFASNVNSYYEHSEVRAV